MKEKEIIEKAYEYLDKGNIPEAEKILETLKNQAKVNHGLISPLLIEIGKDAKKIEYIDEGIKNLEEIKNPDYNVHYNLANGYYSKYQLLDKKTSYITTDEHLLLKAKKRYLKALNVTKEKIPKETRSCININLGNTYDHIGRTIEALDYYENEQNKPHGIINKGLCLENYSKVFKNTTTILKESYNCFEKALGMPNIPTHLKLIAEEEIKKLEPFVKDIKEKPVEKLNRPTEDNFESFVTNFCLDHKLYLNLCNFCQRCDGAIGDTLLISNITVKISTLPKNNFDLPLHSYLNQIKMEYVSARFLLILSQYNTFNLDILTKNVYITESLDYEIIDIYVQLLKNAFIEFYNIFDKISHLINIYFKLNKEGHITFRNIWYSNKKNKNINKELKTLNNKSLNALYDIHLELEDKDEKKDLKDMRNNITHNFLRITYFKTEKNLMDVEELKNNTLELAKLVRNAIIYIVNTITIEEHKLSNNEHVKSLKVNATTIEEHKKS